MIRSRERLTSLAVAAGLVVLTALVYWPVVHHPFVNFDDAQYVSQNAQVLPGLTSDGVRWAFGAGYAGNWHPLTWISHMLDVEWFGLDAGRHHAMNLAWHIANTLLLFVLCRRLTGTVWQSAAVAALFAVHPLHVESVAWVAERKDVLSGFFWILTLIAYVSYVRDRRAWRYLVVLTCFALGLMAKPMVVTLPFVLLLLDFWPLRRMLAGSKDPASISKLLVEKVPFFALSLASSVVTFMVQRQAGAVKELASLPFAVRMENAVVAYEKYVHLTFLPGDLAPLYPYRADIPFIFVAAAVTTFVMISGFAIRLVRTRPYLLTGWLIFLGTLVPVIGLVQIGSQPMADRYTYLPSIGLFIAGVWGLSDLAARWRRGRVVLAVSASLAIVAYAAVARVQVGYWQSSVTLWRHTIDVTRDNYRAHSNLGQALYTEHRLDEAIGEYQAALAIKPDFVEARNYLGVAFADRGEHERASSEYRAALAVLPSFTPAHNNLGLALAAQGRFDAAAAEFTEATRLDPRFSAAWTNLGVALARTGRFEEAVRAFGESLALRPDSDETRMNLATALGDWGRSLVEARRFDDAIQAFRTALGFAPNDANLHYFLGATLAAKGLNAEAIQELRTALQVDPAHVEAQQLLAELIKR
jgi:tetratricopeptide (TPR) repeat protein